MHLSSVSRNGILYDNSMRAFVMCKLSVKTFCTTGHFADEMELKQMLEKLGTPKTHKEVKKMIQEVDTTNSGTISYREFLNMMLGKRSTVLKLYVWIKMYNKYTGSK